MDANKIKKGLGRGLSSLIGETKIESQKNKLAIIEIIPNKFQPRKNFDEENLNNIVNSIRERGIIQPIIVRKSEDQISKYEIIAGERRWLAAQKAGLHEVPVVITEADDLKSLEFAIVENVQRHDLNPLEEAQGYQRLINEFSYDQEKVSKFIGKSRSHVTNCLRILSLPDEVLKLVEDKKLSVRQAEAFVKIFKKKTNYTKQKDPNLSYLEDSITNKIGLNVLIKNKKNNKGQIIIEYKELDQLNKIVDIIKNNY